MTTDPNRPYLIFESIGGGGLILSIEFPKHLPPGPVIISEAHKEDMLIELTGQREIPGKVRIPAVYVGEG